MAWFSILPPQLEYLETWLIRLFLLLASLTIGPWAILIVYDFLLYVFRIAVYTVPIVGGRARGEQRPRAPSLNQRHGRLRRFSLLGGDDEVGNADEQIEEQVREVNQEKRDRTTAADVKGDVEQDAERKNTESRDRRRKLGVVHEKGGEDDTG